MIELAKLMRRKPGDKGFTLIELIIVIAILAALIAILAPQYLKYVEKSRKTADDSTANEIVNACQVSASDPDITTAAGTYTFTWAHAGGALTGGTDDYSKAVIASVGTLPIVKASANSGKNYVVTVTVPSDGTAVTVKGEWKAA